MRRLICCFTPVLALSLLPACEKSTDTDRRAYVAGGGLMPVATPEYDPTYVSSQTDPKSGSERTISFEPLDTFRAKNAEKHGPESKSGSAGAEKPAPGGKASAAKAGGAGKGAHPGKGIFSRIGAAIGGVMSHPGGAAAVPAPAAKSKKPAAAEVKSKKPDSSKKASKKKKKSDDGDDDGDSSDKGDSGSTDDSDDDDGR